MTRRAKPSWVGNSGIVVVEEEVVGLVIARDKAPELATLFESPAYDAFMILFPAAVSEYTTEQFPAKSVH